MVKPMFDVNTWEIVGLAVDVGVVCLLNYFYRNRVKDAELVNSAQSYDVGGDLRDAVFASSDKSLPYVCVTGLTKCIGPPLKSSYNDAVGVIQHQLYVEHKSKRTQGFWTDVKRAIKDKLNVRPFALISSYDPDGLSVEVTDALSAEYLRESLEVVHDHYQPASDGLLFRSFDRLFGEVTKGYQETESMLKAGVQLVGVGKLIQAGRNRLLLVPPEGGRRYILTTTSKQELVRAMRADARALNVARWIFLIAGSAAFLYVVYRSVKLSRRRSESERMLAELRNRRQNAAGTDPAGVEDQRDVTCVVCLHQRREVVLLNCGHICLCGECATALPTPKLCPVCRAPVARIIPTYNS